MLTWMKLPNNWAITQGLILQTFAGENYIFCVAHHMKHICSRDTAMMSMRRAIDGLTPEQIRNLPKDKLNLPVSKEDFMAAIKKINRSVSDDDLEKHKKWSDEFGST